MTVAPEVPGVCEELPPGLSVLGWSDVARSYLLACWDVEPRPYPDQSLLWVVLTDGVTPRNITTQVSLSLSLSTIVSLHAGMVEESLHGIDRQSTAISGRKVQQGPVGGLYSKCVLQVRQDYSGVLTVWGVVVTQ